MNTGEIILYQTSDGSTALDVKLEKETIWINRQQMAELFDRDIKTVGKHINNALKEELQGFSTVAKFATVQQEGDRTVTRNVEHYNVEMITSVGYRVKSPHLHFVSGCISAVKLAYSLPLHNKAPVTDERSRSRGSLLAMPCKEEEKTAKRD